MVSLRIEMHDAQGMQLQPASDLTYLHGGYGELFAALEQALEGKGAGESILLQLEPEDTFGDYDADLLRVEPRNRFPETLEVGMQFEGVPGENEGEAMIYTVTDITGDSVVVDANHPYAGERLWFKCSVKDVRRASDEEIEHGHVHGEAGVHAH